MATFQVRIEDIIGATASLGSDNAAANEQAIQDALQFVVICLFSILLNHLMSLLIPLLAT